MATYVEPARWNDRARKADEEASKLRKEVAAKQQLPLGGKAAKMGEPLWGDRKAAEAAFDHVQNVKESMAEDAEQRVADEYPAGTSVYGKKSRNKAPHGQPRQYANGGMVTGGKYYGKKK